MTDERFCDRIKTIADKSDLDNEQKKNFCLIIAAACDSDEHTSLIENKAFKDGISLEDLYKYVLSILPSVEIEG